HNIERLNIDYGNDNRPSFVIFGITESCTIFLLPAKYISVSNFIDELYWIDKDGKNECYGAAAHIIPVKDMDRPTIAIYFIQRKLLIEVSCEWKFNERASADIFLFQLLWRISWKFYHRR
uniref:Transmembrane protein n=1 Tax=Parascaris univalens TaxID=6257 RepID=A0A914ZS28_PARUN